MPRGTVSEREWTADEARSALSPKARAFAERYQGPQTGTATVVEVGYAKGSASQTCAKLLKDPRVQAILHERRELGQYAGPIGEERVWSPPSEAAASPTAEAWEANLPDAPEWATASAESMIRWMLSLGGVVPWSVKKGLLSDLRQVEKENRREQRDSGEDAQRRLRQKTSEVLLRQPAWRALRGIARRYRGEERAEIMALSERLERSER